MSIKRNLQALKEWAYQNNAFKRETGTVEASKPNLEGLNSRQRTTLKWKLKKGIVS